MQAQPKFAVVKGYPHYNQFDGISGWSFRTIARTMTQGFAHVIQAREDGEGQDETVCEVRDISTGKRVYRAWAQDEMECPF